MTDVRTRSRSRALLALAASALLLPLLPGVAQVSTFLRGSAPAAAEAGSRGSSSALAASASRARDRDRVRTSVMACLLPRGRRNSGNRISERTGGLEQPGPLRRIGGTMD